MAGEINVCDFVARLDRVASSGRCTPAEHRDKLQLLGGPNGRELGWWLDSREGIREHGAYDLADMQRDWAISILSHT
jgi:hypothetical protein